MNIFERRQPNSERFAILWQVKGLEGRTYNSFGSCVPLLNNDWETPIFWKCGVFAARVDALGYIWLENGVGCYRSIRKSRSQEPLIYR